jgi:hypothetical protein
MPDYSLVPVDHQPDFNDHSLVAVDHDPFAEDGVAQQAQFQLAQAQPQQQQQPAAGPGQPDAGVPAAGDGAKRTNFGGVYGHTLTVSEPSSNDLGTATAADPTGLLVATPVEGNPNRLSIREYKGY